MEGTTMYIREQDDEFVLVRSVSGPEGLPSEVVLARLGQDVELNIFLAAHQGRRNQPHLWEGVHDLHLLQALENFKRRIGNCKPVLVVVDGKRTEASPNSEGA